MLGARQWMGRLLLRSPAALRSLRELPVVGAESEVLKGSERLFQSARPFLICEIHDMANEKFITAWLERRNYAIEWLDAASVFPHQIFARPMEDNRASIRR